MAGFNVNIEALSSYSRKLAENTSSVSKVSDLVDQADVGDESWGIVGLFVKQSYTDMLADLKSLLTDMQEGLRSASDKIGSAAKQYQDVEDGHQRALSEVTKTLESTVVKNVQA